MVAEKVPFTDAEGSREIILIRVGDDGEAVITCADWQQVVDFCDECEEYDGFQVEEFMKDADAAARSD